MTVGRPSGSSAVVQAFAYSVAIVCAYMAVPAAAGPSVQSGSSDEAGINIHWTYSSTEKTEAPGLGKLEVDISDTRSGTPLRYARGRIAAWLQRRRVALSDAETTCADRVKALVTQGIGRRADIDVNTYRLLTLNADGTLAFINPFVGMNNAKLESIVDLGGKPSGWLPIPERMEAWILVGSTKLIAVDLQERRIVRTIDLPADSGPRGLGFDATAKVLWIALHGSGALGRLDLSDPAAKVAIMDAPRVIELVSADATVGPQSDANQRSEGNHIPGVISIHEGGEIVWREGASSGAWRIRERPVAARYSKLSRRIIVAGAEGLVAWIDPSQPGSTIERQLPLGHPVRLFALFDDGRLAVAVGGGRASLIDLASAQRTVSLRAPPGANQIVFSASFAYAIDRKVARAMMWSLSDLRAGRDTSAEVILGRADDASVENTDNFETAVPSADGKGLITASRTDGMLYQFAEGMMAPIGSYSNYRRAPLSLLVLDLSLRETEPGRYVTTIKHSKGGSYELLMGGLGPSFSSCSNLDLPAVKNADGALEERIVAVLVSVGPSEPGISQQVEVRLERRGIDGQPSVLAGVADLTVLVFDRLNGWQTRMPMRETGEGKYVANVKVPREGRYELHASSVSRNISFAQGRIGSASLGTSP